MNQNMLGRLLLFCYFLTFIEGEISAQPKLHLKPIGLAKLDSAILYSIRTKQLPGAVVLIAQNGNIVHFKAFGESDIENHKPMTKDAIFRLASMSKAIVTLSLLKLCEEGKCNTEDPISKFLPEFSQPEILLSKDSLDGSYILKTSKATQPILIKHILTHTAGFASQYGGNMQEIYTKLAANQYNYSINEFSKKLAKLPLTHEPGQGWIYGPGILIAGRIIEVITGKPLNISLKESILDQMEMKDTKFFLDEVDAARLTTLYKPGANNSLEVSDPGSIKSNKISGQKVFFNGGGGLNATILDYYNFCQMILDNGVFKGKTIAKASTINLMKTDQTPITIEADISPKDNLKNEGFTFGYQIKRKDNPNDPLPKGSLNWSGATGPTYFIEPTSGIIAILMLQVQPNSQIELRRDFRKLVMNSFTK